MSARLGSNAGWAAALRAGTAIVGALLASCEHAPAGSSPTQNAAAAVAAGGSSAASAASAAPSGAAGAPSAAATAPLAPAPLAPAGASAGAGCRVISSTGPAQRDSGQSVSAGDRFVGSDWLELGKGTRLHLKHTVSGREWTLSGPARVLPCVEGQEELIVAQGKLRTEAGAGSRPGAQVLVGTPFGSLRYADANADLDVSTTALRLAVNSGDTWLSAARPGSGGETHTSGAQSARRGARERLSASAAVAACERDARQSEALAKSLLAPAPAALGKLAAEHVHAREQARASCANATAAVLQQDTGAQRTARLSELAGYRQLWQRVPPAGG